MNTYDKDPSIRIGADIQRMPATFGATMGVVAERAWEENPMVELFGAYQRDVLKRSRDRILKTDAVNRLNAAGVPEAANDIPYSYVSEPWVAEQERLAKERQARDLAESRASGGFLEGAASFGVMLGVSMVDPINVGSAFIPVVGPTRYALALERAATRGGRALVRAKTGVVEGAAGAAMVEPIVYFSEQGKYSDYDMTDSLLNVAVGAVLGGGIHMGAGALRDRYLDIKKINPEMSDIQVMDAAQRSSRPAGVTPERLNSWTFEERKGVLAAALAQASDGYIELDALAKIVEDMKTTTSDLPARQRELFIKNNIDMLDTWIAAQEKLGKTPSLEEVAAIEAKIQDTPKRIKDRTRELQKRKVKFKEAQKRAKAEVEAENARISDRVDQMREDVSSNIQRLDRARRDVEQLRQGNIPERLRSTIHWQGMEAPRFGAASMTPHLSEGRIWMDDLQTHLRSLRSRAERPDNALLRDPNAHAPNKNQVDELDAQETPEDIAKDIEELAMDDPELNTEALDADIVALQQNRDAYKLAATCVARNAA